MIEVLELSGASPLGGGRVTEVLERDGLVVINDQPFALTEAERPLLDPAVLKSGSKNISLDPRKCQLSGAISDQTTQRLLTNMLTRFAKTADLLLSALTPHYVDSLERKRTSFRPGAVETRVLSPRKDDRRLHVDAFPATPVQGRRILRVFANVNPMGEGRTWDVGEDGFEKTARYFSNRLTAKGQTAKIKAMLGLTRGRQSPYDQVMLQLHDSMKFDADYQQKTGRRRIVFPPHSLWVVYTDSVTHAALSGRHAFEQTYLLPVEGMLAPELSPLRTLERVTGRMLI